jgi:hypothetical protein
MRTLIMIVCTLVTGCAANAEFTLTYSQTLKDFDNNVSIHASPKGVEKISWNISPK